LAEKTSGVLSNGKQSYYPRKEEMKQALVRKVSRKGVATLQGKHQLIQNTVHAFFPITV
jgi:hypothetical protein